MIIWDPVECLISRLAALRQRYRCLVDGHGEFHGERLPVGTEEEILDWIKARYKVLGEFYDVDLSGFIRVYWTLLISPEMWKPEPSLKQYRVEVDGEERVFSLRPVLEDLLCWHPERALACRLRDCEEYRKS